jgi:enamine deaminase RidA (YjgF/YER057c/UK114 family)
MTETDKPQPNLPVGRAEVATGGLDYLTYDGQDRPYSQVVRAGNLVYTAGASIGDPGDDIQTQTAKTLDYLRDLLQKTGTDFDHVVRVGVFLSDIGEWGAMNEVYRRYFAADRKPVRTTVQTGPFVHPHIKIEIDMVAVLPGS